MSSTERRREKALRRFFQRRLGPAAERLRERGVRFFPPGPEAEEETWYVPAPAGEPELFELDDDAVEATLRARWEAQALPELAELAGPLLELARDFQQDGEESAEISPFIYVMY